MGGSINVKLIKLKIILANFLIPLVFVIISQIFTILFNFNTQLSFASRFKNSINVLALLIFSIFAVIVIFIILKWLKPLFIYTRNSDEKYYDKARISAIKIPWFLIIFHSVSWLIGPAIGMSIRSSEYPANLAIWILLINFSTGLVGAIFTALVINNVLIKCKQRLNIIYISKNENDKFVRYKDGIILFVTMIISLVYLSYFGYFFFINGTSKLPPNVYYTSLLILSFFIFICALGMFYLSKREYHNQIRFLKIKLQELVKGEGDLTKRVSLLNFDEIGDICVLINKFLDFLASLIATIKSINNYGKESSINLKKVLDENEKCSKEYEEFMVNIIQGVKFEEVELTETKEKVDNILSLIENYLQSINQQIETVDKTSDAINQMVETIYTMAASTNKSRDISSQLAVKTNKSSDELNKFLNKISLLKDSSKVVLDITAIISQIAETTNTLSINASIQASRSSSGAGKGFAVIAREIRKFALDTSEKSKIIENHIKDMDTKIKEAVEMVKNLEEAFSSMLPLIKNINDYITNTFSSMEKDELLAKDIVNSVAILLNASENMKNMSIEQKEYVSDISYKMQNLNEVSKVNKKLAGDAEETLLQLNKNNLEIRNISMENYNNFVKLSNIIDKFSV